MNTSLLPATQTQATALNKITDNSGGLSIITDLDPDQDLVTGNAEINDLINRNDCAFDEKQIAKGRKKIIGNPKLIKHHDDSADIDETLEAHANSVIDQPTNGEFSKEYLFNILSKHCNLIVEDRKILLKEPGHKTYNYVADVYDLQTFLKKFLEDHHVASASTLRKQITERKIKDVCNMCITDYKSIEKAKTFTNDGNYIAVANGIIHVQNGKIELLRYEDNTKLNFKHFIDANYNPDAPHYYWDSFLSDFIGPKKNDLDRFWEMEGNLLFPNPAAKSIIVMYGKGDDGKSALAAFRWDIYTPHDAVFDGDLGQALSQFGTEAFKDAQILQIHEMNGVVTLNQANKIKRITGGDRIMLDKKFWNLVSRLVRTKFIVTCNHLPRFAMGAVDQALENRFQFKKVSAAPKEYRTDALKSNLYTERAYYLTQAVLGYARLQANNFRFTKSAKDSSLKKAVFSSNPAKAFLDDCCITKDMTSDDYILGADWKTVVSYWKNEIIEKFNNSTLKLALINLGYPYEKLTKGPDRDRYAFRGLRFNEFALKILAKHKELEGGGCNEKPDR